MSLLALFNKILQNPLKGSVLESINTTLVRKSSLWEPPYIEEARKQLPEYDVVNVQMKGYDFPVLECYQKLVHRIAKHMDIAITDCYAVPYEHYKIIKYKPRSDTVMSEYKLKIYERNVQVGDVKSHLLPIFIEAVITACPPGVKVSVHEHTAEIAEVRYVPEYEVMELQEQIEELDQKKARPT